jgi:hypothetical protein
MLAAINLSIRGAAQPEIVVSVHILLVGSAEIGLQDAHTSQLAIAEFPGF